MEEIEFTETITGFSSLFTQKKIVSKILTLRIEKKIILPTDRLYLLCCLAWRPTN